LSFLYSSLHSPSLCRWHAYACARRRYMQAECDPTHTIGATPKYSSIVYMGKAMNSSIAEMLCPIAWHASARGDYRSRHRAGRQFHDRCGCGFKLSDKAAYHRVFPALCVQLRNKMSACVHLRRPPRSARSDDESMIQAKCCSRSTAKTPPMLRLTSLAYCCSGPPLVLPLRRVPFGVNATAGPTPVDPRGANL